MIDYKLAEKLREAGFPYETINVDNMIAACGNEFMSLIQWPEPRGEMGRWTMDTRAGRANGHTREEAAAKAWLLLIHKYNEDHSRQSFIHRQQVSQGYSREAQY